MSAKDVDRALAVYEKVKALVPNKANLKVGHGEILAEEVIRLRGLIDTNGDREFIERRFREGLREAELDTHDGGPATCPYDATPLAGLWWTRGYVYGESVRLRAERDSWSQMAIRLSHQMTEVLARAEAAEQQVEALTEQVDRLAAKYARRSLGQQAAEQQLTALREQIAAVATECEGSWRSPCLIIGERLRAILLTAQPTDPTEKP